ncbi:F-box/kelch-repeat protein At3g06240-like [Daucus carota subsp. sativus]|uniref:F-box/kelch-repeat protein At3g06240-like n=1 Tax=Daucus carota subsp. sativus TaxID=79200 RepID=UPI0030831424
MAPIRPNPTLSNDLISEILVRVPVKSLLQFQLVSKTWLSLIKDPSFVKAQLRRAIATETDESLIMTRYTYMTDTENATLKFSVLDVDSRQIVSDLKYPYTQGESQQVAPAFRIVGSVNGIVCVVFHHNLSEHSFYLWNPATGQSRAVPACALRTSRALGFGYDPVDNDYKIVSVVSRPSLPTEVYSANRNVWRKVPSEDFMFGINGGFILGYFDVSVNGFLFGVEEDAMIVFDLNTEVLNCAIKLPPAIASAIEAADAGLAVIAAVGGHDALISYAARPKTRIIEYNKSIAVITLWANALNDDWTDHKRFNKAINLWKLEDDSCLRGDGVEASWTLMFSIDLPMRPAHLLNGYYSNGDLVLLVANVDDRWIWCNASKKEAKIVRVDMVDHCHTHYLYRYTESLVSLSGFKQISWNRGYGDN